MPAVIRVIVVTESSITVEWDAVSNANVYVVSYFPNLGAGNNHNTVTDGTQTTVNDLKAGTWYSILVEEDTNLLGQIYAYTCKLSL